MIFVDTSAFLAVENRKDACHQRARRFMDTCLKGGETLVTTDYVLDESYTIIRLRAGHAVAVDFGEGVRRSRFMRVESVTSEIIDEAWRLFKKYGDHEFSFTDCTSFVVMERLTIAAAFAFDDDFQEYGQFHIKP